MRNFTERMCKRGRQLVWLGPIFCGLFFLLIEPPVGAADKIYLKDKRKIEGIIDMSGSNAEKLVIRTSTGILSIPRSKIEKIEKEAGVSYAEGSGDLEAAAGRLERALELYRMALATAPESASLKRKIADVEQKIQARDRKTYGDMFSRIERLIEEHQYDAAIKEAEETARRVKEESAKTQCRQLIARVYLAQARRSREFIDYPAAEKFYKQAMAADAENSESPLELASLLQTQPARKRDAIELFQQGIALAVKHPGQVETNQLMDYRFKLGQILFNEKQYREAADVFLGVTREDKSFRHPEAVDYAVDAYTRIQLAANAEDIKHIIDNLQSIIRLKPREDRAYLLLGRIYFDRQEWANARDMLAAAVHNADSSGSSLPMLEALYYLAISHRHLGENDPAAEALDKMVSHGTTNYDAICELADIRQEQKSWDEALKYYDKAIALDGDRYRAHLGKGFTLKSKRMYKEARDSFKAVVDRDKENIKAHLGIARSYYEEEAWEDAASNAQKAIELMEGVKEAGKEDGKEPELKKVIKSKEDKQLLAELWTLVGDCNYRLKKNNESRENFGKAIAYEPAWAPALAGTGLTYEAEGLHKDAEQYFLNAVASDPKKPDYYLRLGVNWHKYRQNTEKALSYYMKYLELGGTDPQVPGWIKECGGTTTPGSKIVAPVSDSDESTTATAAQ